MRCMNDNSSHHSSEKEDKPKKKRLLFKSKISKDNEDEDSYNNKPQSDIGSSEQLSKSSNS